MKTYSQLVSLATNLSNNTSASNKALVGQLVSDQHRYLIQRWFDNERIYTTTTIGAQDLEMSAPLSEGAISGTLAAAWPYASCVQLVVFSNSEQRTVRFSQGQTFINWQTPLTSGAGDNISALGVQAYPVPSTVSKISNNTITVGQLVYTPAPVRSIQEWTKLNAIPYTSDIPNYYFIYNQQVQFWPIPSTTGNIITFNYKGRVPDLSFQDYSTGTISGISAGSTQITGIGTAWNSTGDFPLGSDIDFFSLYFRIEPPDGDGIWYPIQRFESNTSLILALPIQNAPSSTAQNYTIGQLPLLQEDFHDMLVYGALKTYFTSIVKDESKFKMYDSLYAQRLELLKDYAGTKSINVDLGPSTVPQNPNLYLYYPPR